MNIFFLKLGNGVRFRENLLLDLIKKLNPASAYILDVNDPLSNNVLSKNIDYTFFDYLKIKNASYSDVKWKEVEPLDPNLLEELSSMELEVLDMMEREVEYPFAADYFSNWIQDDEYNESRFLVNKYYRGELSFKERKIIFNKHLRYWNDFFKKNKLTHLIFLDNAPHGALEFIIYSLAKRVGVKTILLANTPVVNHSIIINDYRKNCYKIVDEYQKLLEKDIEELEPNSLEFKKEWQRLTADVPNQLLPTYEYDNIRKAKLINIEKRKHLFRKFFNIKDVISEIKKLDFDRIYFLLSLKNNYKFEHDLFSYYKKISKEPDLTKKYIYVPLHFQPEMTTSPLGGRFVNQELMIEMLSFCAPNDVVIYVKEHRMQKYRNRNFLFYNHLEKMSNVLLISPDYNTFDLMERAIAVATVTGTAGWEGLFKSKPFLMFGYHIYQYAPYVFPIRSIEDCKHSLEVILNDSLKKFDIKKIKAFFKAVENKSFYWRRFKIDSKFEGDDVEHDLSYKNLLKILITEIES